MNIYIYDKNTLQNIATPVITNITEFKTEPTLFYPDWNAESMIFSENQFIYPKLENGELVEKTRVELVKENLEQLHSNELLKDNQIIEVDLKEFEFIENNEIKYNRDGKLEKLATELNNLKVEYSEKAFVFKDIYLQKNRDLDKNNLTSIVLMTQALKQNKFKNWKFKDLEDNDVYVDISLEDMMTLAQMMQAQTTKSMITETTLHKKVLEMSDNQLKDLDVRKEFEKLWRK